VARLVRFVTKRRSLFPLIPLLTVALLFASGPDDLAVPQQPKGSIKAGPSEQVPLRQPTAEERKFIEAGLQEIGAAAQRAQDKDWEKDFHDLVDQALDGKGLPESLKAKFQSITNPDREKVHQFVDREMARLKQQLQQRQPPTHQKGSGLDGEQRGSYVSQKPLDLGPALHPHAHRTGLIRPFSIVGLPSAPLRPQNEQSFLVGWHDTGPASERHGNLDMTGRGRGWINDETSVGVGIEHELKGKVAKGDTSVSVAVKKRMLIKVDRCPKADGPVSATVDFSNHEEKSFKDGTRDLSGNEYLDITYRATAHVADDARLKEKATFEFEVNHQRQTFDEKFVIRTYRFRFWGDGEFNPNLSSVVIRLKGCINEAGDALDCSGLASSINNEETRMNIARIASELRDAEKKWNLDDQKDNSHCLTAKFTPKTKTVRKKPSERVDVKIELLTKKSTQPTWGKIEQLEAVKGDGKVSPTSAAFTPDKSVQVTYTVPTKPWPPNDPPGFDIVKATSRTGVIKRGQSPPEDVEWRLATAIRLAIHQRFELMFGGARLEDMVLSDVRFFLDLAIEPDGRVSGQAVVPREESQSAKTVVAGGTMTCKQRNTWTELWEANGKLDEASQQLMFKLRFQAGPKSIKTMCKTPNGDMPHQWSTGPGTRSDAMKSPLDNLVMAAKDGEKRTFEFPVPPAKTLIEIKVVTGEGDPSDQPTPPPKPNAPGYTPAPTMPKPPKEALPGEGVELKHGEEMGPLYKSTPPDELAPLPKKKP